MTENENRVYEALKVVLQELPVFAADNAYNAQPNASSLESIEHETKKRTNIQPEESGCKKRASAS